MNIKSLQHFLHLAESKSFTITAQKTHISLSALSRLIQRLEQELGQTLFIRDNRQVELTTAGKELLPVATSMLNQWHHIKAKLNTEQFQLQGKLTLFCSVTASYSHLPQLLTELRHTHPNIEIQLLTGDPVQAIDKVLKGDVDIAIAAKPDILSKKLTYIEIDQVPMSLIGPAISPLGLKKNINDDLDWHELPFILPESGPARDRANNWLKKKKIIPLIYAQSSGHEAIVSMVALGCGVGIAPDVVIDNSPVSDKVQRFTSESIEPMSLGLCCKQSRKQEPLLDALLQLFNEGYSDNLL